MAEHPAVAFLLAAHQQAEAWARAATPSPWTVWEFHDEVIAAGTVTVARMRDYVRVMTEAQVEADRDLIIAMAQPAAVLRRVAAERELLTEHANDGCGDCMVCARPSEETNGRGYAFIEPLPWPCRTVLLLAQGWGWEETA